MKLNKLEISIVALILIALIVLASTLTYQAGKSNSPQTTDTVTVYDTKIVYAPSVPLLEYKGLQLYKESNHLRFAVTNTKVPTPHTFYILVNYKDNTSILFTQTMESTNSLEPKNLQTGIDNVDISSVKVFTPYPNYK